MLDTSKVIWKEGMFLQPQHFQQMERYLLNALNARFGIANPNCFGLTEIEIDTDALSNDLLSLTRCTGVLPDGVPFSIPREDSPPPARSFSSLFGHDQQMLDVYLGVPLVIEGKANVAGQSSDSVVSTRYKSRSAAVIEEVQGAQRKEIELGGLNFSLLFGGESLDSYATVQVCRLRRNQAGQIELHDSYIPPLLQVGGSRFLMTQLRGLLEMLLARISSLSQGRRQVEGGFAEFAATEETAFRLLEALNVHTPLLNHYHHAPWVHPFELFSAMTTLGGALCTFSVEVSLKNLPRYDHLNLSGTFGGLLKVIRSVLEADISAGCVTIPVEQVNPATYACKVPDERLFASAKFFLGVTARVPEKELIIGVLQRITMSSRDRLDLLISSAMPGLPLLHTSRPPDGLSTKPGYIYFSLDQQSQFWKGIQSSGNLAFYFPNNYPDLKVEMLALKE